MLTPPVDKEAFRAEPPSPVYPNTPFPQTVFMIQLLNLLFNAFDVVDGDNDFSKFGSVKSFFIHPVINRQQIMKVFFSGRPVNLFHLIYFNQFIINING